MAKSGLRPLTRLPRNRQLLWALIASTALLAGCQSIDHMASPTDGEWRLILADAAIIDGAQVVPPLTPILSSRARLVTLKRKGAPTDLKVGEARFPRAIWTTVDGELQSFCRHYVQENKPESATLHRRIERLLGLRAGDGDGRVIVTLEVAATDVSRPCPDPTITTTACTAPKDDAEMRRFIASNPEASQLLLSQMIWSYVARTGYPFTRRGYTYDWDGTARADHFGLSEYEIRPNAEIVIVAAPKTLDEYCAAE